ncbi:MAG: hypothetical protein V2A61_05810, partial [Calditrichota bacterium]
MKRILILSLATILLMTALGSEAVGSPAEATAIFLLIAPGARAGGMGETFVAVSDDATATWWNPAGLAFIGQSASLEELENNRLRQENIFNEIKALREELESLREYSAFPAELQSKLTRLLQDIEKYEKDLKKLQEKINAADTTQVKQTKELTRYKHVELMQAADLPELERLKDLFIESRRLWRDAKNQQTALEGRLQDEGFDRTQWARTNARFTALSEKDRKIIADYSGRYRELEADILNLKNQARSLETSFQGKESNRNRAKRSLIIGISLFLALAILSIFLIVLAKKLRLGVIIVVFCIAFGTLWMLLQIRKIQQMGFELKPLNESILASRT